MDDDREGTSGSDYPRPARSPRGAGAPPEPGPHGSSGPGHRQLPHGDPTLLRSVAAVLAGFCALVIGVMIATRAAVAIMLPDATAAPTTAYLAVNIAYSAGLAVLAGYLTAKAAPKAPQAHALVLAGVLVFITSATLLGSGGRAPPGQPQWYPWLMLCLGPAGVVAGGLLRRPGR